MPEEVIVDAAGAQVPGLPRSRASDKPPDPLGSGLLTGATAGAVFGGPIGALVGAGFGILAKRLKKTYLDEQTAFHNRNEADRLSMMDELKREQAIADPDEMRMLNHAQRMAEKGYAMLEAGDDNGYAYVDQGNAMMVGIMTADRQHRAEQLSAQQGVQRDLVSTATKSLRDEYQGRIAFVEEAHGRAQSIFQMTSQPGFDPNNPTNKAILADTLTFAGAGMYRDAPDIYDAMTQGAGTLGTVVGAAAGGPVGAAVGAGLGTGAGAIATAIKSKDYKLTTEDYNRFAMNLQSVTERVGNESMQRIATQARNYETYAKKAGILPADETVQHYVTGGADSIKFHVPEVKVPQLSAPNSAAPQVPPTDADITAEHLRRSSTAPPRSGRFENELLRRRTHAERARRGDPNWIPPLPTN